jgi:hypothetical protein
MAEQVGIKAGAGRRVLDIEQDETEIWHLEDSWLNIAAELHLRYRHKFSLGHDPAKNCQQ